MIELRNVEKTIKSLAGTVWLLRRINVAVKEGEFVTVMGPSGAGKTTLLSIIGMLDDGWAGDYFFADHAVHKLERKKRAELNRRYQSPLKPSQDGSKRLRRICSRSARKTLPSVMDGYSLAKRVFLTRTSARPGT